MLTCYKCYSQNGINVGFSPIATTSVFINESDGDNYTTFGFKNVMGFQIGYERDLNSSWSILAEFSLYKGTFYKVEMTDGYEYEFNPFDCRDYSDFDFSLYCGKTINRGGRFQIPLYLGIGVGNLKGGLANTSDFKIIAVKARFQYYLTNRIGFYIGAKANVGWDFGDMSNYCISGDAGMIFNF